jgi:hypothetical protein
MRRVVAYSPKGGEAGPNLRQLSQHRIEAVEQHRDGVARLDRSMVSNTTAIRR